MNKNQREEIALFRYGILAPLISGTVDPGLSNQGFFRLASQNTYVHPYGHQVTVSETSLKRWYRYYQKDGFEGLIPKRRGDSGTSRKLDDDMKGQIAYLKKEYPRLPATVIYEKLIQNGTFHPKDISLSTITRFINQLHLENKTSENKDMRRYEKAHINEVWYADSSTGVFLKVEGKKKRVWIIAAIDDASRMITSVDVFFHDNFINVMSVLKSGIMKYGKPKILSFDNGSAYKNNQIKLLAARISTSLYYNPPYTPTGKAKIERWFKTLKDRWMSSLNMNDFSSLEELRTSLLAYVKTYNQSPHSSLNGMSPQDRFFQESHLIIRLEDDHIQKSFMLEIERRVSADSVISIDNKEYEVHYRYAKKKITLRYAPDFSTVYIVDHGSLTPIKLLDKAANGKIKRDKVKLTGGI